MKKRAPESDVRAMAAGNAERQEAAALQNPTNAQLSSGSDLEVTLSLNDAKTMPFTGTTIDNGTKLFASVTATSEKIDRAGTLYIAGIELVDMNAPKEAPHHLLQNCTLYPSPSSLPDQQLTSPQPQIASTIPSSLNAT